MYRSKINQATIWIAPKLLFLESFYFISPRTTKSRGACHTPPMSECDVHSRRHQLSSKLKLEHLKKQPAVRMVNGTVTMCQPASCKITVKNRYAI